MAERPTYYTSPEPPTVKVEEKDGMKRIARAIAFCGALAYSGCAHQFGWGDSAQFWSAVATVILFFSI